VNKLKQENKRTFIGVMRSILQRKRADIRASGMKAVGAKFKNRTSDARHEGGRSVSGEHGEKESQG
jgi:hypothetical protein